MCETTFLMKWYDIEIQYVRFFVQVNLSAQVGRRRRRMGLEKSLYPFLQSAYNSREYDLVPRLNILSQLFHIVRCNVSDGFAETTSALLIGKIYVEDYKSNLNFR